MPVTVDIALAVLGIAVSVLLGVFGYIESIKLGLSPSPSNRRQVFDAINQRELIDKVVSRLLERNGGTEQDVSYQKRGAIEFASTAFHNNIRIPDPPTPSADQSDPQDPTADGAMASSPDTEGQLADFLQSTRRIMRVWADTPLAELSLNPVGAAIGYAYLKKFIPGVGKRPIEFLS